MNESSTGSVTVYVADLDLATHAGQIEAAQRVRDAVRMQSEQGEDE